MPSIFRYLRRDFMEKGKFFRYFKYALGEIILVVLGILIALKINQYNEKQKTLQREAQHLEALLGDIRKSSSELERTIVKTDRIIKSVDSLLIVMESDPTTYPTGTLITWIFQARGYTIFSSGNSAVQELISSGEVNIIRDKEIRDLVSTWDTGLHEIRKYEEECKWVSRSYHTYLAENLDLYRFVYQDSVSFPSRTSDPKQFFHNSEFLENLFAIHGEFSGLNNLYRKKDSVFQNAAVRIEKILSKEVMTP